MPCKREKYIEVMGEKEKFEIVDLCEKLLLSLAYASYDVFATLPKILDAVLSISLGNGTIIKTNFEVDQPMWIDYGMQILLGRDRLGEMVEKRSEILTKTLILNQLPFIKSKITKKNANRATKNPKEGRAFKNEISFKVIFMQFQVF